MRMRMRYAQHLVFTLTACFLLLAFCARLNALSTDRPLREYGQRVWQSDSGLPQNTVRAIAQTREGYLWIGTEAGLVRFDGIDFDVFNMANTPAFHSDVISSLKESADGSLWIGTPDGLVCERGRRFTRYDRAAGLPSPTVLSLYLTRRDQLLALTPAGAALFNTGHFVLITGTESLGLNEGASMVAEDAQSRLWVAGLEGVALVAGSRAEPSTRADVREMQALAATASGELWMGGVSGLQVLRKGGKVQSIMPGALPSNDVTSLLAAPDEGMWIGTSKGLALSSQGVIKALPELAGAQVQSLFLDHAGALWVATSEGLARVVHGHVDLDTRKPLLAGVLSIFEDREGSMWFGTETAGLHVLRDQAFTTITMDDGLTASLVRAVFEDHAGAMWIGTSGGSLDHIVDGRATQFKGSLPSKVILALAETESAGRHDLWVGTPEGLARIRGGDAKVFTTADGLADDFVRSLYGDRDGSLWIGTRNGLSHFKDGVFRSYSKLDGLPSDLIGAIMRSRDGRLWVGTLGGLSVMTADSFTKVAPVSGPPDSAITAMLEDRSGSLWVGSNGLGLSRVSGVVLTPLGLAKSSKTDLAVAKSTMASLPGTIYGMLEDEGGDLWLSSRTGVDRVSIAQLDAFATKGSSPQVTHYGSADGMRISEASGGGHPAAARARDGGLWFATLNGVAVVHPHTGPRDPTPPLSAIEQVIVDDQMVAHNSDKAAIHIAPGHPRLAIKYAGLSFVAPQRVRYRYMLKGFDKDWVEAGTRRTAFYTNVPPGSYRFLVLCANSDGVWSSQAAEQYFTFEPLFYQTGWFYALVLTAVAGLGYFIYRWRVLTVEAQYRAVAEERGRIAREIHDTLAQGYVAISVQLELAERLISKSTDAALQQLKQTKDLVREGLAEARSSIWNLRAQADAETLPALLAAYVSASAQRHGSLIKFTVHGAYRPLARSVEEEVLRIAQQAVANAVAHAKANCVTATLNYDARWLELQVSDDGIGMQPDQLDFARRGHFGMQGMRERAIRIGSVLEVESAPGLGVTIKLRVDLSRSEERISRDGEVAGHRPESPHHDR